MPFRRRHPPPGTPRRRGSRVIGPCQGRVGPPRYRGGRRRSGRMSSPVDGSGGWLDREFPDVIHRRHVMRTRPPRRSRPPVRLISYGTAPAAVDGARPLAPAGPGPLRHRPGAPLPAPPARTPQPRPRPALRAVPTERGVPDADLAAAAMVIARAFAEVMAGIRPLHHLAGRATPAVYERLGRVLPAGEWPRRQASPTFRVRVPQVQEPAPGVAEVCAVVFAGVHAQALALRLERRRGRWRCAAVETTISTRSLRARPAAQRRRGTAA
jgi:hypothetical protein